MEDEKIIQLYIERDEAALSESSKKYGAYLMATAFNVLKNREDSEECVSDGYLKTWNSIPPAKPNNLKLYIARIVRNSAIDKYLADKALKRGGGEISLCLDELSEIVSGEDNVSNEDEITRIINGYLKGKEKEPVKIFVRRYWYMDSVAKISLRLNISQSKVKTTLFRMREELKEELLKGGIGI